MAYMARYVKSKAEEQFEQTQKMDENILLEKEKEDPLEKRENDGSSQGTFLDQRGILFDQLL